MIDHDFCKINLHNWASKYSNVENMANILSNKKTHMNQEDILNALMKV